MTEIEQKALALVNEVRAEWGGNWAPRTKPFSHEAFKALCRAIEQHEAFRREVSEAVKAYKADNPFTYNVFLLDRFIIPQPDPLVEVLQEIERDHYADLDDKAADLRAALAARGLKIVEDK